METSTRCAYDGQIEDARTKFFRKLGRRRVENLDRRTLERDRIGKSSQNLPTKLPEISVQVRVKPNPSMRNAKRYNNVTRVSCYFHTCQS